MPVEVIQPSLIDEDDEELPRYRPLESSDNKGKRKAPEE
jgi:hypothetical protein